VVEEPGFGVSDTRGIAAGIARQLGNVHEIAYDPWGFRESAEILADLGFPMVEFPQSAGRMAPASEQLYELVGQQRVVHNGDETLRAQVLAAVAAPTDRGGWKISKLKSLERIDAAVTLAMASDRAMALRYEKPQKRGAAFL